MQIESLSPAGVTPQPRRRDHDETPTGKDRKRQGSGFSKAHVILDLSVEVLQQLGHEPISIGRRMPTPLFIYNKAGAFAYNEPAQPAPPTLYVEVDYAVEKAGITKTTVPNSIVFEGMLGT